MQKTIWFGKDYYKGEVNENGKRHGQGTQYWEDGERFVAIWENDKATKGTYYYNNGTVYDGEVRVVNKTVYLEGKATIKYNNGERYVGHAKNGLRHGQGTYYYQNGSVYKGQWENGERQGKGIYKTFIGVEYKGIFDNKGKEEIITGTKTDFFKNVLEGRIVNCELTGKGKVYDNAGFVISEGDYLNSKLHGRGTYYYRDGTKLEGTFRSNKAHGECIFYAVDGSYLKGNFVEGALDGDFVEYDAITREKTTGVASKGVKTKIVSKTKLPSKEKTYRITYKNKDVYVGQTLNGLPHGYGVYTHSRFNKVYKGVFEYGKLIKGKIDSIDYLYEGEFKRFMRHGTGVQRYSKANQYVAGQYKGDNIHGNAVFSNYLFGIKLARGIYKCDRFWGNTYLKFTNDTEYFGKVKNWKPWGKGTIVYGDHHGVIGRFKDGLLHGKAIELKDGKSYACVYDYGKCISKAEKSLQK